MFSSSKWCFQVNSNVSKWRMLFSSMCFQFDYSISKIILFLSYISKFTNTGPGPVDPARHDLGFRKISKNNQNQSKEAIETQFEKLNELNDLINVFKSGKEIRHLLGMILKLGNYMNGGNRNGHQFLSHLLSAKLWSVVHEPWTVKMMPGKNPRSSRWFRFGYFGEDSWYQNE